MLHLQNLPLHWRHFTGPVFIALCSVVLFFLEPASSETLAYDIRFLPWQEPWRWISGHWVHTNDMHMLLNLAGLLMLWLLHGHYYQPGPFTVQVLFYAVLVTLCIYHLNPELKWYAGLSGVLHGLFTWGACQDIAKKQFGGKLLLMGVWVKIGYEQLFGGSEEVAAMIGARVATEAHLYGAIAGLLWFAVCLLLTANQPNSKALS